MGMVMHVLCDCEAMEGVFRVRSLHRLLAGATQA